MKRTSGTLAQLAPDVATEWAVTLNGGLTPSAVGVGSGKAVWWRCAHGHVRRTKIYRRVLRGCVVCKRIAETTKKHAAYWDEHQEVRRLLHSSENPFSSPHKPYYATQYKWACPQCGKPFRASIADRLRTDSRQCNLCSSCGKNQRLKRFKATRLERSGCLSDKFPEIAAEWAYDLNKGVTPAQITASNNNVFWWRCDAGHTWKAKVGNRTHLGRSCPQCNDPSTSLLELRIFSELDLPHGTVRLREKVAGHEADLFIPKHHLVIECDGYPWHANPLKRQRDRRKEKQWTADGFRVVRIRDKELPRYLGHCITFRERGTLNHHEIIRDLVGLLVKLYPHAYGFRTKKKLLARMDKFPEEVRFRELSAQRVSRSDRRLSNGDKRLLEEWDYKANAPMSPERVSLGSSFMAHWVCADCGNQWTARVANRVLLSRGCPKCAKERVQAKRMTLFLSGNNTLAAKFPEISKEWDKKRNGDLTPSGVAPFSNTRVAWICSHCGNRWHGPVANRTGRRSNCPVCWGGKRPA